MMRAGIVAATAALLGACASSPPMRYYTLTPIAPEARVAVPADTAPIQLSRISVPGELDRVQLVRRLDATRLQIAEQDRWAAPLEEMIRRVLSADLAARLPPELVVDPNESVPGERRQGLAVDIQDFYADAGCAVTLRATWVLSAPLQGGAQKADRAPAATQVREETQVPGGACSGAGAVPEAMSRALALLSDRIAARIANPAPARAP
jgi:uncharacterized protein